MWIIIAIAVGGATGALLRYSVAEFYNKPQYGTFPYGTLMVNLLGAFAIGFLWNAFDAINANPNFKKLLLIGVLGAFTTFSAYAFDNLTLLRSGQFKLAGMNIFLSNIGGLVLVYAGFVSSKSLFNIFK